MYNKLFAKIVDSSIWLESESTRLVWLTMIAIMDQDGFVAMASIRNLSRRANLSYPKTAAAIVVLESPDDQSSDPDNDGRRIERVPGGWLVLNAPKYRDLVTREVVREQTRERVRRHRMKRDVTQGNAEVLPVTPSETDATTEVRTPLPRSRGGRLKRDELKNARHLRSSLGGCTHEPRCATYMDCVSRLALQARHAQAG